MFTKLYHNEIESRIAIKARTETVLLFLFSPLFSPPSFLSFKFFLLEVLSFAFLLTNAVPCCSRSLVTTWIATGPMFGVFSVPFLMRVRVRRTRRNLFSWPKGNGFHFFPCHFRFVSFRLFF